MLLLLLLMIELLELLLMLKLLLLHHLHEHRHIWRRRGWCAHGWRRPPHVRVGRRRPLNAERGTPVTWWNCCCRWESGTLRSRSSIALIAMLAIACSLAIAGGRA